MYSMKTYCNILTQSQAKCVSVKFCQFVASLYSHKHTNCGRFSLIFNNLSLIFLGILIVFTISSFEFQLVSLP